MRKVEKIRCQTFHGSSIVECNGKQFRERGYTVKDDGHSSVLFRWRVASVGKFSITFLTPFVLLNDGKKKPSSVHG